MRRERRKKKIFNPQTMLHLEYSLRTEKKTPQHKSTYTINTWLATWGTYPALASSHPVQCHLFRRRSQTCSTGGGTKRFYRGSWMGEGSNVRSRGRGGKDFHSIALTGWLSRRPWPRRRYGEPEKIRLSCCDFGANSCKAQLILFVHSDLWNHQVSLPKLWVSSWWYPYFGL